MILTALVHLIRGVCELVIGALPSDTISDVTFPPIAVATNVVGAVMPWHQVKLAVGVMLAWILFCHGYRIILWVLGLLHITGDST